MFVQPTASQRSSNPQVANLGDQAVQELREGRSQADLGRLAGGVPQQPLQGLSREVVLALRPLDLDCGPEWKADYGMLRLAWSAQDVEEKIAGLDRRDRRSAAEAERCCCRGVSVVNLTVPCDFCLTSSDNSSHATFVQCHRSFLQRYPGATQAATAIHRGRSCGVCSLASLVLG